MAVGSILRGCHWAADGPAIAPHPAMKARSQLSKRFENFAIWVMRRAVRDCLKNVPTMR